MSSSPLDAVIPDAVASRYTRKLALAFLVVVVVVAGIGGWLFLQTTEQLEDDTEAELETSATVQARELSRWVDQMREESRLLSRAGAVSADDPDQVQAFLRDEISSDAARLPDEIVAIHYLDTERMEIVTSTNENFVGVSPREEGVPWAQSALSFSSPDDTLVTRPFRAPAVESPVIAVISPVAGESDRALVLMVDLSAKTASMPRPSGGSSFTVVVDDRGTNVLAHDTDLMLQQHVEGAGVEAASVKDGLSGGTGYTKMPFEGAQMAVGYAPVAGTDWVVLSHVPASEAFALRETIGASLLVLLAVTVVGLGTIGATVGWDTARALTDLSEEARRLQEGDLDADLDTHADRRDEIGTLYAAFADMRDALRNRIEQAERARSEAEAARERTERMNRHLQRKADEYGEVMAAAQAGDLSARMDPDSENDAMRAVGESFNEMMARIEAATAHLKEFAAEVAAASEEVTASSEEVKSASEQVATSVQAIAEGATDQHKSFDEVTAEMDDLTDTIDEIASSAETVEEIAVRTAEVGRDGRDCAHDAIETMDEVAEDAEASVEGIRRLQDQMAEIEELVEFITDISKETNMLALNAGIEASRSDGAEGFTAIAEQVRDLADETQEAAQEAEDLIDRVQEQTQETAEEVESTSETVVESTETVREAADALDGVATRAENTAEGVSDVSAATQRQARAAGQVEEMVETAAEISTEAMSEAETVAAAAEEQTSALTEVSQSVSDLAVRASRLRELLDSFRTDADTAGIDPETVVGSDDEWRVLPPEDDERPGESGFASSSD